MIIIACLDDNDGMLFNKRRQSSDAVIRDRVLKMAENSRLLMNEYSAKLFDGKNIIIDNSFLKTANNGDYCFVENEDIFAHLKSIEKIVIYRWNRKYPSDFKFSTEILQNFKLESSEKFVGNSHSEITEEVYSL